MGKLRSKSVHRHTANVISLSDFRERRFSSGAHRVFYLTDSGKYREEILALPSLQIEGVISAETLRAKLLTHSADIVLIEAALAWTDPVAAIHMLSSSIDAPIVMIADRSQTRDSELMKRAYAAGVHDTLYAPLCPDEVAETFSVLLKYRRSISLHQ